MDVLDQVAENDLGSVVESASSLIRQLKEAFVKLEAHKDASEVNLRWKDFENHFHQIESMLKKKLEDLKAKEEEFAKKESEIRRVLAEREAVLAAKEQVLLDQIQDLKNAAVSAIVEARTNHIAEPFNVTDGNDNKVSSSLDDENAPGVGLDSKAKRYTDLIQSCKLMDANGLLKFITENHKDLSVDCSELSVALSSATEPARLVLESLKGFFPSAKRGSNRNDALKGLRHSCLLIMEALASMLAKADPSVDNILNLEIQGQAKAIADEWMRKLAVQGNNAANGNGNSLEVEGFLRLLATFRIGSEFDQDELCKLVLAVAHRHRQATQLCLSLGLTQKMPGIIEVLSNNGKLIDAVHLIQAFQLSDAYPPVPLLMAYLKDVRRNSQGKAKGAKFGRDASLQAHNNMRELTALKNVVKCVKDYNLQADYPLAPLESRIAQLMKSKVNHGKKRIIGEPGKNKQFHQHQQPKRVRTDGGFQGHHSSTIGNITRHAQVSYLTERASRAFVENPERYPHASYPVASQAPYGGPERYPHASYPVASQPPYGGPVTQERYPHASYPVATQAPYGGPETQERYAYASSSQAGYVAPVANDQKAYYYVLDDVATSAGSYGAGAPGYVSYTGGSLQASHPHQPYM